MTTIVEARSYADEAEFRDEVAACLRRDGHTVYTEPWCVSPGMDERQHWRRRRADLHVVLREGHPLHARGLGVLVVECKVNLSNSALKTAIAQANSYLRGVRWRTGTTPLPRPEAALICTSESWGGRFRHDDRWMAAMERIAWLHHAGFLIRQPGREVYFRLRDDEPAARIWSSRGLA